MHRAAQAVSGAIALLGIAVSVYAPAFSQQQGKQNWTSLDRLAEELYNKGDLKHAIQTARLAVEAASGPRETARSLDRLGFFEYTDGNLKDGEASLRRAFELRKATFGTDSLEFAESANDLALLCRDSARLPEARELAAQAVDIRTRLLGANHSQVAESLNVLGSVLGLIGDYDTAISHFEKALAIQEAQPSPSEEYGTLCVNAAGTYQRMGRYAKAQSLFAKGIEILRVKPGVNHPAYSASLAAYAYLEADLGHFSAAEKLYAESGNLLREQLGEQHPFYSAFLNNRAALYAALGNLPVAEADYRRSLELKRKIYGPDALTLGASLRNLARLVRTRNPAEGEKLFQEAVDLYGRHPKAPPFDYGSALLGLGEAQRARGDLTAATETLRRASEAVSKGLGTQHPLYAAVLRETGAVHESARDFQNAGRFFQEATEIAKAALGEDHPDVAQYLERQASFYEKTGKDDAALPLYRRSLEISERELPDRLSIGSLNNKAAAGAAIDELVSRLVWFQRRTGDRIPGARALAFEAVARRKGQVVDEVHDWGQYLRENADEGVRSRFREREALLGCEASLTIALGYRELKPPIVGTCTLAGTGLEGRYERLLHELRTTRTDTAAKQALQGVRQLRNRIDALEAGLSRDIPQLSSVIRPARSEEIQAHVQPGEVLVECVSYRDPDSRAADQRYGAFLLGREAGPSWVDLGAAKPIDESVQDLIRSANDWSTAITGRESHNAEAAESAAQDALHTLSARLRPLVASLTRRRGIQRVRVAPDAMLNLVPFAAIQDPAGKFLIERYTLSYVSAGRDLAALHAQAAGSAGPVIAVSPGAGPRRAASTAMDTLRAGTLERLDDAEREARDVQRWIPSAQLLGEGEATEQRIKRLRRPALLHVIGHGVVRGNEDCRLEPGTPGCELATLDPAARIMSLSAIVLEEAYGRGGRSADDGLLTALELQNLDLQGTQMVVLSQCRMADGVPTLGEGVYGMRRAAAIAGVSTFIAPLWKVSDAAEQVLMDRFYKELSGGAGRADALRRAQLELQSSGKAGFLTWAPVILSGDPAPLPKSLFAR